MKLPAFIAQVLHKLALSSEDKFVTSTYKMSPCKNLRWILTWIFLTMAVRVGALLWDWRTALYLGLGFYSHFAEGMLLCSKVFEKLRTLGTWNSSSCLCILWTTWALIQWAHLNSHFDHTLQLPLNEYSYMKVNQERKLDGVTYELVRHALALFS